ncbi:Asparagine synthetase [glutamine-hydrolyzing] 1 [anaerobic digester metagenome]
MCGICGIFGKKDENTIKRMLSVIPHRGPDDEFFVSGNNFCIGARRLSIIDLEHGRQPLSNEDESIWVAQNGEIYNYPDINSYLRTNHQFKTNCDTEAIVHLYEECDEKFLNQLSGMFAIGLWDSKKNIGILARDKVGKKPLYYHIHDGCLYFASEIKCLLEITSYNREINYEALHYYLSYKHIPCPLSIFSEIFQLPPSHFMKYDGDSRKIHIEGYWHLDFYSPSNTKSEEEIVDNLIDLLIKSVKKRLIGDVPIGFFLSGGLDSSLITAIAATISPKPIHTFSLIYEDIPGSTGKKNDEHYAREISLMYNTIHHEERISVLDFKKTFLDIIRHFDEPFSGVFSTYFLSRLISRHVKVALSGDGADELFGSYLSHRLALPVHEVINNQPVDIDLFNKLGNIKTIDSLKNFAEADDWKWRYKLLVFSDEEKKLLYGTDVSKEMKKFNTCNHLKKYFSNLSAQDPLNRILESEFHSFFPDQVLTFVDRLSMAHSLEVRAPYLDSEFVEYAAKIPGNLKIKGGETKYILKKVALKYLPKKMVFREKEGFIMPFHIWLRDNLEEYVRGNLSKEHLLIHGFFNEKYVEKLLDEYFVMKYEHTNKILTLLAFQIWYESYMV